MSNVIAQNLQGWRQKAADGTITVEEMRAAVACIREERLGKGVISAKSKETKAKVAKKKEIIDSDSLLGELF